MIRVLLLGTLLVGTANALSFFVRSKGWGGLLATASRDSNPNDLCDDRRRDHSGQHAEH